MSGPTKGIEEIPVRPLTQATAEADGRPRRLRVEANLPCALKAPLEIALAERASDHDREALRPVDLTVQSDNAGSISNHGAAIDSLDAMPDLTVAAGYNTLLDHAFQKRFATADNFAARPREAVSPRLAGCGFADPLGIYRVIGVNVFVFVADPSRLAGRPAPDSWDALLSDDFVDDVAICGSGDKASKSLMLHVHGLFGENGVRRLGRNVRAGMHPSQYIKGLGTGRPECPAVAVMPWFFARLAGIRRPAGLAWPRDGAVAMPFFLLAKRRGAPGLGCFVEDLEGREVGRICSGAGFPALHPDAPCPLPDEARLSWLGWGAIRDADLAVLRRQVADAFEAGRQEVRDA